MDVSFVFVKFKRVESKLIGEKGKTGEVIVIFLYVVRVRDVIYMTYLQIYLL